MTDAFYWDIDPELVRLGPFAVRYYGLLFALAFVHGFYLIRWVFVREGKGQEQLDPLFGYVFAGTLIGARLGHCVFYDPGFYLLHPLEMLKIWEGGLASHGAVIGILTALFLYVRSHPGYSYLWLLDRIVLAVAPGGALIRLGNFFNSEILGTPTQLPWAVVFARYDTTPRHPAQLYESLAYLCIYGLLLWVYRRPGSQAREQSPVPPRAEVRPESQVRPGSRANPESRMRAPSPGHPAPPGHPATQVRPGLLFGLFLVTVFGFRILVEFVKLRQAAFAHLLPMTMGQLLSIPVVIGGGVLLVWALRRPRA